MEDIATHRYLNDRTGLVDPKLEQELSETLHSHLEASGMDGIKIGTAIPSLKPQRAFLTIFGPHADGFIDLLSRCLSREAEQIEYSAIQKSNQIPYSKIDAFIKHMRFFT